MSTAVSTLRPTVVRAGSPEETEAIIDVVLRAFEKMRSLLTDDCWSDLRANIRLALGRSDDTVKQTAWSGSVLVGGVAYSGPKAPRNGFPPSWSYIRALGVEPAYGGRGVGRLLVQSCIDQARKDQAFAIGLYTADVNTEARRLYTRLGFVAYAQPVMKYGLSYCRYTLKI